MAVTDFGSEPLVLRPSKLKWSVVAAVSLGLVAAAAVVIAASGDPLPWAVLPWLLLSPAIAIFGFGFLLALAVLLWPGNRLEIDDDGFTLWSFGRMRRVAWRQTTWGVSSTGYNVVCVLDGDVPGARIELPYGYGGSSEELARLMNEHRARAEAREGFDAARKERDRDSWLEWW